MEQFHGNPECVSSAMLPGYHHRLAPELRRSKLIRRHKPRILSMSFPLVLVYHR